MRIQKAASSGVSAESDMTPMIDMTFQLIAFFMVLLNFGEGEQDARIKLPGSELAKPPNAPFVSPIVIQVTDDNHVLFAAEKIPVSGLTRPLLLERQMLEKTGKSPAEATVIIRADAGTKTGTVQEIIQKCQENRFEKFAPRVKQEQPGP